MLKILRNILNDIINDIDSGNSYITENELEELISFLNRVRSKELSKEQAAAYIGVSRATFDNYINNGWIPKGRKVLGFKELHWNLSDLDEYLKNKKGK